MRVSSSCRPRRGCVLKTKSKVSRILFGGGSGIKFLSNLACTETSKCACHCSTVRLPRDQVATGLPPHLALTATSCSNHDFKVLYEGPKTRLVADEPSLQRSRATVLPKPVCKCPRFANPSSINPPGPTSHDRAQTWSWHSFAMSMARALPRGRKHPIRNSSISMAPPRRQIDFDHAPQQQSLLQRHLEKEKLSGRPFGSTTGLDSPWFFLNI